jgi:hypothetical protein
MRKLLPLIVLLGLVGCAAIPLNENAKNVKIVEYLKPALKKKLTEIDRVVCDLGMNGKPRSTNKESCINIIKNKAADLGGTYLLAEPNKQTRTCNNCFHLEGIVYGPKK